MVNVELNRKWLQAFPVESFSFSFFFYWVTINRRSQTHPWIAGHSGRLSANCGSDPTLRLCGSSVIFVRKGSPLWGCSTYSQGCITQAGQSNSAQTRGLPLPSKDVEQYCIASCAAEVISWLQPKAPRSNLNVALSVQTSVCDSPKRSFVPINFNHAVTTFELLLHHREFRSTIWQYFLWSTESSPLPWGLPNLLDSIPFWLFFSMFTETDQFLQGQSITWACGSSRRHCLLHATPKLLLETFAGTLSKPPGCLMCYFSKAHHTVGNTVRTRPMNPPPLPHQAFTGTKLYVCCSSFRLFLS